MQSVWDGAIWMIMQNCTIYTILTGSSDELNKFNLRKQLSLRILKNLSVIFHQNLLQPRSMMEISK